MLDRIKRFIETQNMTASGFANEIGVQRSSVSHILSGRNKPSLDFILKLKDHFPDLNLDWLLFGSGPILMSKTPEREKRQMQNEIEFEKPFVKNDKESSEEISGKEEKIANRNMASRENFAHKIDDKMTVNEIESSEKDIKKIILLYGDGSFEEFNPKN